jgi:hypothetical protein
MPIDGRKRAERPASIKIGEIGGQARADRRVEVAGQARRPQILEIGLQQRIAAAGKRLPDLCRRQEGDILREQPRHEIGREVSALPARTQESDLRLQQVDGDAGQAGRAAAAR